MPSETTVPSAPSAKARTRIVGDSACTLLKLRNAMIELSASTPPVRARSARPASSSAMARLTALRLLAQAASMAQVMPPRSNRLAMRPATTLARKPGKLPSPHSG